MKYDWPGNVRELQNGIERAFYSSFESVLTEDSLRYVMPLFERPSPEPARPLSGKKGRYWPPSPWPEAAWTPPPRKWALAAQPCIAA
jgi:DNA-binding NtrC family response regulator